MSALKNPETDRSEIGVVIAAAKGPTRLMGDWRIAQVKREGNTVANALAGLARQCKSSEVRWHGAPACALDFLKNDCNLTGGGLPRLKNYYFGSRIVIFEK